VSDRTRNDMKMNVGISRKVFLIHITKQSILPAVPNTAIIILYEEINTFKICIAVFILESVIKK
jgi:hypothetical protein